MAAITQLRGLGPGSVYVPFPFADKAASSAVQGAGLFDIVTVFSGVSAAIKTSVGTFAVVTTFSARWSDPLSAGSMGISSGITQGEVDDF